MASRPRGSRGLGRWVPNEDGSDLVWDGGEKFYEADAWMAYLIEHFLRPGAHAAQSGDEQFAAFSFDHVLNGEIEAQGESVDDRWLLCVVNSKVTVLPGRAVYG